MEFTVGRPQKPFVVEVKRGRRGAVSGLPTAMLKLPEPAPEAAAERRPAPPREPPKPQRRILDAIEPAPAPVVLEPGLEPVEAVASDPLKRRRGRPPKAAGVPAQASKRPAAERREQKPVVAVARREFLPVPVAHAAPTGEAKIIVRANGHVAGHVTQGHMTHGHVTHVERVEAATALPRGERWKRRLPKVLW
jgi:hypothetical protein